MNNTIIFLGLTNNFYNIGLYKFSVVPIVTVSSIPSMLLSLLFHRLKINVTNNANQIILLAF